MAAGPARLCSRSHWWCDPHSLLQEDKIRLEACTEFLHTNLGRYSCLMAFEGGVQPWHWRKCAHVLLFWCAACKCSSAAGATARQQAAGWLRRPAL